LQDRQKHSPHLDVGRCA